MSRLINGERKLYQVEDGITQSILTTYLRCKERCRLMLNGWQKIEAKSPFTFGSCFHYLCEVWACSKPTMRKLGAYIPDQKTINGWCDDFTRQSQAHNPIDPQDFEQACAMAVPIFTKYLTYWKDSHQKWQEIKPEIEFDITIPGDYRPGTHRLRGKVDGLVKINGKYWLLETKTMSQINEDVLQQVVQYDFQTQFYIFALETMLGVKIVGVIYNVVRVPMFKMDGKTPQEIQTRTQEELEKDENKWFKRFEVAFSDSQVARFRSEMRDKLVEFKAWKRGEIPHYRNETSCIARGNCPYIQACSQDSMVGYAQTGRLFSELSSK